MYNHRRQRDRTWRRAVALTLGVSVAYAAVITVALGGAVNRDRGVILVVLAGVLAVALWLATLG